MRRSLRHRQQSQSAGLLALPDELLAHAVPRDPRAALAVRGVSHACRRLADALALELVTSDAAVRCHLAQSVPAHVHVQRAVRLEHVWRKHLKNPDLNHFGPASLDESLCEMLCREVNSQSPRARCRWCSGARCPPPSFYAAPTPPATLCYLLALACLGTGGDWLELQIEALSCLSRHVRRSKDFAPRAAKAGVVELVLAVLRHCPFSAEHISLVVYSFEALDDILRPGIGTPAVHRSLDRAVECGVCEIAVAALRAYPTKKYVIQCTCDFFRLMCYGDAARGRRLQLVRRGAIEACCEAIALMPDPDVMCAGAAFLANVANGRSDEARARAFNAGAVEALLGALKNTPVTDTYLAGEIFRALGNIIADVADHRHGALETGAEDEIIAHIEWVLEEMDQFGEENEIFVDFRQSAAYALDCLDSDFDVPLM
jgi:hypothetical protein